MKIAIVGGGIGGLTAAHLLKDSGHEVCIYERDINLEYRTQGYSIGIDQDSIKILQKIRSEELEKLLEAQLKNPCSKVEMTDSSMKCLLYFKGLTMLVSRWGLRNALTCGLDINWNKKFVSYEETEEGKVKITFDDNSTVNFDLLIGADGAKSKIRAQRCPDFIYEDLLVRNFSGSFAISNEEMKEEMPVIASKIDGTLIRCFGKNSYSILLFGYEANNEARVLWSISWSSKIVNCPIGENEEADTIIKKLVQVIDENFNCKDLMKLPQFTKQEDFIPLGKVFSSKIYKTNPYLLKDTSGNRIPCNVTLLGDAAHPMTTHRGAGANTAIRDAERLASILAQFSADDRHNNQILLEKYEEDLFKDGFKSVSESRQSTNMIHQAGFSATMRNWFMWGAGFIVCMVTYFIKPK